MARGAAAGRARRGAVSAAPAAAVVACAAGPWGAGRADPGARAPLAGGPRARRAQPRAVAQHDAGAAAARARELPPLAEHVTRGAPGRAAEPAAFPADATGR